MAKRYSLRVLVSTNGKAWNWSGEHARLTHDAETRQAASVGSECKSKSIYRRVVHKTTERRNREDQRDAEVVLGRFALSRELCLWQ